MDHAHSPERSEGWFRRTLARICSAQLDGIVARHTCLDSCMEACKPVCIHACLPNVQNSGMVYLMRRSFAFRGAAMHRRRRLQYTRSPSSMMLFATPEAFKYTRNKLLSPSTYFDSLSKHTRRRDPSVRSLDLLVSFVCLLLLLSYLGTLI